MVAKSKPIDAVISRVDLYQPRRWFLRLDVFPFVLLYGALLPLTLSRDLNWKYTGLISLPLVFACHVALFLVAQWSTSVVSSVGSFRTESIARAQAVRVYAAKNAGADRVIPLEHRLTENDASGEGTIAAAGGEIAVLGKIFKLVRFGFHYQQIDYQYDQDSGSFRRLQYPVSGKIHSFLRWTGYSSSEDVLVALKLWGLNEFDIPLPGFLELYLTHLVAPFFVFQVLCLFLWSLDDYWYYSAFTMLMLMFFEGMMCKQRQSSLMMLRNMRRPAVPIFVYREGKWGIVETSSLVPGDVVSVTDSVARSASRMAKAQQRRREAAGDRGYGGDGREGNPSSERDEQWVVPCDIVLTRGSCIVNEAMLTGETIPQVKESLRSAEDPEHGVVDCGSSESAGGEETGHAESSQWRRYMLFSGTVLLQCSPDQPEDTTAASTVAEGREGASAGTPATPAGEGVELAPDRGCIGVVVRTGFGTSQGTLMRKILFATERVTGGENASETFYFIGVLVVFAVLASVVVLREGIKDESRNKFRLVLHCIMIITSVVPPELPMELSLSVTNSLVALGRSLVYCTEPFRIAYAGKLDILCFDKTGTLTKDQMILKGVVAPQDIPLFDSFAVPSSSYSSSTSESSSTQAESSNVQTTLQDTSGGDEDVEELPSILAHSSNSSLATTTGLPAKGDAVRGGAGLSVKQILESAGSPPLVLTVMGSCHDLLPRASADPDSSSATEAQALVEGDPIEVATMESSGFYFVRHSTQQRLPNSNSSNSSNSSGSGRSSYEQFDRSHLINNDLGVSVRVLHKYPFSSSLKRMSVVVEVSQLSTAANADDYDGNMKAKKSRGKAASGTNSETGTSAAGTVFLFMKGAPECVLDLLSSVPPFYRATYHHYMSRGKRVLAMAVRKISGPEKNRTKDNNSSSGSGSGSSCWNARSSTRAAMETGLQFAGFLVFDCDLKVDSKSVIRELRGSNHRVAMITGDSVYTAADVGRRLGMMGAANGAAQTQGTLILHVVNSAGYHPAAGAAATAVGGEECGTGAVSSTTTATAEMERAVINRKAKNENKDDSPKKSKENANISSSSCSSASGHEGKDKGNRKSLSAGVELVWRSVDEPSDAEKLPDDIDFSIGEVSELCQDMTLCVTGPALQTLQRQTNHFYPSILRSLCGHIRIFARVSPLQKEAIIIALNESGLCTLMCGDGTNDVGALKKAHVGISIVNNPHLERKVEGAKDSSSSSYSSSSSAAGSDGGTATKKSGTKKPKGASSKDRMARAVLELQEQEADPTIVKLGDASIASPFTARRTSIDSVLTVLRQGRCTLVTSIQVYKILALNCLVSAYMMSALYLKGLKQGDTQMTATGLIVAGLFFFLSQAKPLPRIDPKKPPSSVFSLSIGASICGQFAVHLCSLLGTLYLCDTHVDKEDFSLSADGRFHPNIVNSAVFLLSATMQVNNFVVNYRGHPFTQSITENVTMWRSIQGLYICLLIVAGGQLEPLNDFLQLAPFPSSEFQTVLIAILLCNFGASYTVELLSQRLE